MGRGQNDIAGDDDARAKAGAARRSLQHHHDRRCQGCRPARSRRRGPMPGRSCQDGALLQGRSGRESISCVTSRACPAKVNRFSGHAANKEMSGCAISSRRCSPTPCSGSGRCRENEHLFICRSAAAEHEFAMKSRYFFLFCCCMFARLRRPCADGSQTRLPVGRRGARSGGQPPADRTAQGGEHRTCSGAGGAAEKRALPLERRRISSTKSRC